MSAGAFRPLFTHTFEYIAYHQTSYNYYVTCFQGIKTVLKLITDNLQQFNLSYNMDKNCFIYNVFFSNRLKSFVGNTENTENTGNTENTENTGIQRIQGIQRTQGIRGIQRFQGKQGIHGILGIQGTQGIQGIQEIQKIQRIQGKQ